MRVDCDALAGKGTMRRHWFLVSIGLVMVVMAGGVAVYNLRFDPLPQGARVDRILVEKSARRLTVFQGGHPLKSYSVALGRHPVGAKRFEGDGRTPEGRFIIDWRKKNSSFHRALHVSYPRATDDVRARAAGRSAGGAIMVHGLPNGLGLIGPLHRLYDWTNGCIALTDAEIDELWRAVPNGTPIEIRP